MKLKLEQHYGTFYLKDVEDIGRVFLERRSHIYISSFEIYEQFRGKGYSYIFLKLIEEYAINIGVNKLKLDVMVDNVIALNVYTKLGYIQIKQWANIISMEKYLNI